MRRTNKIIVAVIIVAVMLLGIGYAAIQNITLNITGTATADPSQANFTVRFSETPEVSDTDKVTAVVTDDLNATLDVSGLTTKGETVTATYTIQNTSTDLSADLSVEITNSNEEYFTIESELGKTSLVAGEVTTLTVSVELIKTPISTTETSTIGIQLTAEPVQPGEEGETTGGTSTEGSSDEESTGSILTGTIRGSENLMISLDAKNWAESIDLSSPLLESDATIDEPYVAGDSSMYTYVAGKNNLPTELLPVSGNGNEDIDNNSEMSFYTGTNINEIELYQITKTKAHKDESTNATADLDYAGFYAIDLFLQNSSKIEDGEIQGESTETLQLNTNSLLKLLDCTSTDITELQNATRVALAMYDTEGLANAASTVDLDVSSIYVTATQEQVLQAYSDTKISDIAIWEPNASTHTDYVVTNNNTLKLETSVVDGLYIATEADESNSYISKFTATEVLPTYALTSMSLVAAQQLSDYDDITAPDKIGIRDKYDWKNTDGTGLERQIALQTDTESDDGITEVRNLVSITSPGANIYKLGNESDAVTFEILKNSIIKLRMYLWLEGQDPDIMNQMSYDGEIYLDLGLTK